MGSKFIVTFRIISLGVFNSDPYIHSISGKYEAVVDRKGGRQAAYPLHFAQNLLLAQRKSLKIF
jgi:hypothetical protein